MGTFFFVDWERPVVGPGFDPVNIHLQDAWILVVPNLEIICIKEGVAGYQLGEVVNVDQKK